ncbi:hypothetical protein GUITHDRAFT_116891 [Guillardia theta CCMP2712]|uniref:Uncharacterized protein n=1 Tax=Guillardia theta (strain CCMP2712) TaxID=905079 RepID=L1IKU5_GUITC|nr:hypothetical protein GUITHDRAFT_116891 [Guillardia theta CCMP2712]EKX36868.1 hypothetical protein GUITHDRAFT_116891 [Guillardia theta CCMP2712]|eukprot:XP_005823848.1 hypothetical protein GUITHDRAFT_116891 [Guillardia theta CCMP2712]
MLDVDVGAVLDLGKVTSNGNHVLRAIKIRNHGEGPMLVHLSSDRPQEISFQLHNDNLPDSDSSSSASLGAENDFNQLFNTIGIIHELQIPARSEQRVVLTYLPARYDWENQDDALSSKQTIIGGQRDAVSLTSSKSVIGPVSGTVNSPVSVSGTLNFTGKILGGGSTEGGEIHTCSVRLLAQVCKSVLALQPTEIMLSSCVPGGIYYRDFTLLNLSNIPLYFSMILSPATSQAVANKTLKLSEKPRK